MLKKSLLFLTLLASIAYATEIPVMNPAADDDIVYKANDNSVVTDVLRIDSSEGALETAQGLIHKGTLTGDLTIEVGETLEYRDLDIPSGKTLTVNGTLITYGLITGAGTLAGTGPIIGGDPWRAGNFVVDGLSAGGALNVNPATGFTGIAIENNAGTTGSCATANSVTSTICTGTWNAVTETEGGLTTTSNAAIEERYIRIAQMFIFSGNTGALTTNAAAFFFSYNLPTGVDIPSSNAAATCSGGMQGDGTAMGYVCRAEGVASDKVKFACVSSDKSTTTGAFTGHWFAICRTQ